VRQKRSWPSRQDISPERVLSYNDGMREKIITAIEMAKTAGVTEKAFRARLRKAKFPWHVHSQRWEVVEGSPQHREMKTVLDAISKGSGR